MTVLTHIQQVVRGNYVTFTTSFYDDNRIAVAVGGANLALSYRVASVKTSNTIAMASTDGGYTWNGQWDTSGVDPAMIYWNIHSTGDTKISEDGTFIVNANDANV